MAQTKVTDAMRNVTQVDAAKITTGTIPDARIQASGVTQHVVATDTSKIENDIAILALHQAINENKSAYSLANSWIEQFENSTYITLTNTVRDDTEFISSVSVTDGDDSYTKMLLHFDDTALANTASSTTVNPTTKGACSRSSTYSKFGSYSMGTTGGSGLKFAYDSAWMALASQSYTIDFWYRFATFPSSPGYALFNTDTDSQGTGIRHHNPTMNFPHTNGAGWGNNEAGTKNNYAINTWYHVAVVYDSSSGLKCYIDGTLDLTDSNTGSTASGAGLSIMGDWGGGNTYYPAAGCYMDEFRFSLGIARWTGNFTPYTAAYGSTIANATGNIVSTTIAPQDGAAKTSMGLVLLYKNHAGTNALNSDIVCRVSADNGSNYTTCVLAAKGTFSTGILIAVAPAVAVTSGTQLKYKVEFANQASGSKEARVHGVAMTY